MVCRMKQVTKAVKTYRKSTHEVLQAAHGRITKEKDEMDEEALIQAAQKGDLDSFNQLVLRYQDLVYARALWFVNDPADAEDMTQESFLKAYRGLSTFRGGSIKSWLLRIVMNTCKDELRRKRRVEILSLTPQRENGEEKDWTDLLVDPGSSIEEQVERSELRSSLQMYLDGLQDVYRETVYLVDVLELDYHEASQTLGVPIGTVKSRLARGRWHLRNRILGDATSTGKLNVFPTKAG